MVDTRQTYLDSGILHSQRASNLSGSTTVHNAVILDKVADNAQSVVERPLRLIDDLDFCQYCPPRDFRHLRT